MMAKMPNKFDGAWNLSAERTFLCREVPEECLLRNGSVGDITQSSMSTCDMSFDEMPVAVGMAADCAFPQLCVLVLAEVSCELSSGCKVHVISIAILNNTDIRPKVGKSVKSGAY